MSDTENFKVRIAAEIARHAQSFWPDRVREDLEWLAGPVRTNIPGFVVHRFAPPRDKHLWHYVTNGAWRVETEGPRLEFLLTAPSADASHVETLAMVANFHADIRYRAHLGKVIEIGRPWVSGSICDHLLLSLPYQQGPKFEYLQVGGLLVRFLWLLPITSREAAYARNAGVKALEDAFERSRFDTMDPSRKSIL